MSIWKTQYSDSSDDTEMTSPFKKSQPSSSSSSPSSSSSVINSEQILKGSIRSASYNIIFQILTRLITFGLNGFILRYINHQVLGICNVRLALLYSSIIFISREPFRRSCLRKKMNDNWTPIINLIWFVVPNTMLWSIIFGYTWSHLLSQPGEPGTLIYEQYQWSVYIICITCILDSINEVPYILAQYFLMYKLRIIGDGTLIAVRSTFLCMAVIYFPQNAISYYAIGSLVGVSVVCIMYYSYFYYYIEIQKQKDLYFSSILEFFPNFTTGGSQVPLELYGLVWSFYKQGILKQILTEGERYLMTFCDLLTFEQQGIYDLISSLGSLTARFIFLPIEENAYFYFAQSLERKFHFTHSNKDKILANESAQVLGILVRLMLMIGLVMVVYGIAYSHIVLYLYGGKGLGQNIIAINLLKANCIYILIIGLNGILESFTFAAMTQAHLDKFNKKLIIFSIIFLTCACIFSKIFGGIGFYIANSLNMCLRIGQSIVCIKNVYIDCEVNPFKQWRLDRFILIYFGIGFICIHSLQIIFEMSEWMYVICGIIIFLINIVVVWNFDKPLFSFFIKMYKLKST